MCFSGQQKPREVTSFQGYQTSMWNDLFIGEAFSLCVFGQFSCLLNNLQLEIKVNKFPSPRLVSLQHIQFITVQGVSYAQNPCLLFSTISFRIIKVFIPPINLLCKEILGDESQNFDLPSFLQQMIYIQGVHTFLII